MKDIKTKILFLRVENPYEILGIIFHFHNMGYDIDHANNPDYRYILALARTNKWITVFPPKTENNTGLCIVCDGKINYEEHMKRNRELS